VKVKRWMPWLTAALAAAGLSAAAVSYAGATHASKPAAKIKVGLVTDIGGLNDRGFNQSAYQGLKRAIAKLGITGKVLTSSSQADYIPNFTSLIRQKYNLIIGVGFLQESAMDTIATKYANTKFAGVDIPLGDLKHKPKNFQGIVFKENEVGCLAGDVAARVAAANITPSRTGAGPTIGWVGGIPVPAVIRYGAGYRFCAKRAVPGVTVLKDFSQDFVAQDKCKELALKHYDAGSTVEFQVAGGCGLGVLAAAKEQGKWGIGVDVDQKSTAPRNVLTSAEKKVDVGVYDTIRDLVNAEFKGGRDHLFALKDGGVGLAPLSSKVPASIRAAERKTEAAILNGKLKPPTK
jgi:basic membrane protein A and related proteins